MQGNVITSQGCLSVSEGFVCVSVIKGAYADNLADAVDQLLIIHGISLSFQLLNGLIVLE